MGYVGIALCFFVNAISFGAVVISLFFVKLNPVIKKSKDNVKVLEEIKDGLKYIYNKKILLYTVLILAIVGTFAPNFNVLVPVFAKEVLNQNEAGFGILMSFMGFGSFLGAMFIATKSKSGPKKFMIYIVPLIVGASLIITGYTNMYLLTGLLLAITGFFFISFTSSANSTLQLNSSNEYRGRVMSVYSLVFSGSTPFGNLYAGLFSEYFSARIGFAACGIIIILLMLPLFWFKARAKDER
jgi:predicted MFS family arabinose efflux permease